MPRTIKSEFASRDRDAEIKRLQALEETANVARVRVQHGDGTHNTIVFRTMGESSSESINALFVSIVCEALVAQAVPTVGPALSFVQQTPMLIEATPNAAAARASTQFRVALVKHAWAEAEARVHDELDANGYLGVLMEVC